MVPLTVVQLAKGAAIDTAVGDAAGDVAVGGAGVLTS